MFKILIIAIVLVGLAFAGFAIKMLLTKNGEFKKSCSSMDPKTGERYGCSCGHGSGGESCENKSLEH
jgi:hypothetical protein